MDRPLTRRINLALQGGGAHGAFTWGTLDRLLDAEDIEIAAISATSAGAMNAAAFKSGYVAGGRDGARAALADFWNHVSGTGSLIPDTVRDWLKAISPLPAVSAMAENNPLYHASTLLTRTVSPYDANPTNFHPLRAIVEGFDFGQVCADDGPALHIAATNVRSGKVKVFAGTGITADAILASACLPTLYKAVEIDGEAYWDGGYMGNPALFPLFASDAPDIVIVHINPIERTELPRTAAEIENRINEISFNATLLRELRAIEYVQRLLDTQAVSETEKRRLFIHSVADDETMTQMSVATKLTPTPALVGHLHDAGYAAMDRFLSQNGTKLGKSSTCDLHAMFA